MSQPIWSQNLETPGIGYANKVTQGNYTWWHGQSDNLLENPNGRDGLKGWNLFYNTAEGWAVDARGGFKTSYFWNKKKRWVYLRERNKVPVPSKNEFEEAVRNGLDLTLTASEEYSRTYCTEGRDSLQRPRYEEYYLTVRLYTEYVKLIEEKTVGPVRLSGPCDWNDDWKKAELSFKIPQGSQVFYVEFEHGGVGAEPWGGRYGAKMRNAQVSWRVQPRAIESKIKIGETDFPYTAIGDQAVDDDLVIGNVEYDSKGNALLKPFPFVPDPRKPTDFYPKYYFHANCNVIIDEKGYPITNPNEALPYLSVYNYAGDLVRAKNTGGDALTVNCNRASGTQGVHKTMLQSVLGFLGVNEQSSPINLGFVPGVRFNSISEFMRTFSGIRWPLNTIFYKIGSSVEAHRDSIKNAMNNYNAFQARTGLTFYKVDPSCSVTDQNYLRFTSSMSQKKQGYVSSVGKQYYKKSTDIGAKVIDYTITNVTCYNLLILGCAITGYLLTDCKTKVHKTCGSLPVYERELDKVVYVGNIEVALNTGFFIHEVGHTLGLVHEQKRPNRDDYIGINFHNISEGDLSQHSLYSSSATRKFFEDFIIPDYFTKEYDFNSIMHYDPCALSSNGAQCVASFNTLMGMAVLNYDSELSLSLLNDLVMYPKPPHLTPLTLKIMSRQTKMSLSEGDVNYLSRIYNTDEIQSTTCKPGQEAKRDGRWQCCPMGMVPVMTNNQYCSHIVKGNEGVYQEWGPIKNLASYKTVEAACAIAQRACWACILFCPSCDSDDDCRRKSHEASGDELLSHEINGYSTCAEFHFEFVCLKPPSDNNKMCPN